MITLEQINKVTVARPALKNVDLLAAACNANGFPFFMGLAILEKESGGRNVYGNDAGGALAGYPGECSEETYKVFRWLVDTKGMKSNGVGPLQITYSGHFPVMAGLGLKPWIPLDNIMYGIQVLMRTFVVQRRTLTDKDAFWAAAKAYNGASIYADDAMMKAAAWIPIVGTSDTLVKY